MKVSLTEPEWEALNELLLEDQTASDYFRELLDREIASQLPEVMASMETGRVAEETLARAIELARAERQSRGRGEGGEQ